MSLMRPGINDRRHRGAPSRCGYLSPKRRHRALAPRASKIEAPKHPAQPHSVATMVRIRPVLVGSNQVDTATVDLRVAVLKSRKDRKANRRRLCRAEPSTTGQRRDRRRSPAIGPSESSKAGSPPIRGDCASTDTIDRNSHTKSAASASLQPNSRTPFLITRQAEGELKPQPSPCKVRDGSAKAASLIFNCRSGPSASLNISITGQA